MNATGLNCGGGVTIHPTTFKAVTWAARYPGVMWSDATSPTIHQTTKKEAMKEKTKTYYCVNYPSYCDVDNIGAMNYHAYINTEVQCSKRPSEGFSEAPDGDVWVEIYLTETELNDRYPELMKEYNAQRELEQVQRDYDERVRNIQRLLCNDGDTEGSLIYYLIHSQGSMPHHVSDHVIGRVLAHGRPDSYHSEDGFDVDDYCFMTFDEVRQYYPSLVYEAFQCEAILPHNLPESLPF